MIHMKKKCHSCKNYWNELHGTCPHFRKIQEGLEVISSTMTKVHPETESKGLISVVTTGHWLAECDFECKFFNKTLKDFGENL
jgi:transposase-like protein